MWSISSITCSGLGLPLAVSEIAENRMKQGCTSVLHFQKIYSCSTHLEFVLSFENRCFGIKTVRARYILDPRRILDAIPVPAESYATRLLLST